MKNRAGGVIYVGKAISLRQRVRSYFQESANLEPRLRLMVSEVADFDYTVVNSETEALILEFNLVKQHRPYYNVRLKDDKHFPYIRIPVAEPFPPITVVRRPEPDGARYFGPYISTRYMWETIRLLRQLFRLRLARHKAGLTCDGRPWDPFGPKRRRACLDYYIGLCLGPCAETSVTEASYGEAVQRTVEFLEGHVGGLLRRLRREMEQASRELRFESAGRLRDQIAAVEQVTAQQRVLSDKPEDLDIAALAMEQDTACAVMMQVREGRLIGQSHFLLENITGLPESEVLTAFVKSYYMPGVIPPPEIVLAEEIQDQEAIAGLFAERRGGKVRLAVPKRGKKKELLGLAAKNALHHLREAVGREELSYRRAEEALIELQQVLKLAARPQRIECYDISNLFGNQAVGSMVVFEGGRPRKAEYRRFKIRLKAGQPDDYAMMREVLERRLRAGLEGAERFSILPNLIMVDGGKGQLNVALSVLEELALKIPAVGLAKEFESIYVEGKSDPISLPRHSRSLHLLQAIRDEAHRFAISYHRLLREKGAVASILDSIPGIGVKRRQALLAHFASLEAIRQAGLEEVAAVPGMNRAAAEVLLTNLHARESTVEAAE